MGNLRTGLLLGAVTVGLVAGGTITAQAKTYAKVTKITTSLKSSSSYVTFTGKNALYSKAGTLKGAKLVKTTSQLLGYTNSDRGMDTFMWLRTATTNRHSIYVKVRSFDNKVTGWIYAGKTTDYSDAYAYYKDKSRTKPAGGIEMYCTFTDSTLTHDEKTSFYQLKSGTTAGSAILYSNLPDTSPLAFESSVSKQTDLADHPNTIFMIGSAVTRTRQGDRWLGIASLNDTNQLRGMIKASTLSSLTKLAPVSAKDGITVNYVDYQTKKQVGSVVVPFVPSTGKSSMDLSSLFYDYQGVPDGYYVKDEGSDLFGRLAAAKTAKPGDVLTDYVLQK
jgi:hypothetical protein